MDNAVGTNGKKCGRRREQRNIDKKGKDAARDYGDANGNEGRGLAFGPAITNMKSSASSPMMASGEVIAFALNSLFTTDFASMRTQLSIETFTSPMIIISFCLLYPKARRVQHQHSMLSVKAGHHSRHQQHYHHPRY
jgi:hypothetical protein